MFICKYCEKECKNNNSLKNHETRCPSNVNRNYKSFTIGHTAWNKGLTKQTNLLIKEHGEKLSSGYATGRLKLSGVAAFDFETRSRLARNQGFGGYRENSGRSKKFRVKDSNGKEVVLQSTYELLCSELLNDLGIKWIRPKSLRYDGKLYFPDFYLPEYDIFLDPKNNFKAKQDELKIQKVIEQNNVKVFILTVDLITKDYIQKLVL